MSQDDIRANADELQQALEAWKSASGLNDVSPKGGRLEELLEALTNAVIALSKAAEE